MGILKQCLDKRGLTDGTTFGYSDLEFLKLLGLDTQTLDSNKLGEITFSVCLKHLSECLGKLSIGCYSYSNTVRGKEKIVSFPLNEVLNLQPNNYMTSSTFFQSVELNRNYYGNAYIYIETIKTGKAKGSVKGLWLMPSDEVQPYIDSAGLFGQPNNIIFIWTDNRTGKRYSFFKDEVIHLKSAMTFDGIIGLSLRDIIKTQINAGSYAQNYLTDLYKSKMHGSKILLHFTGDMGSKDKDALIKETERYANSVGSGLFLPLPSQIQATKLDLNLSDLEFAELNKLSALQIASFMGIKPNILNDYTKSSYSNSVTQQTDFYVNSLQPILKQYNEEFTIKLLDTKSKANGIRLEFNTKELFRLDPSALIDYLQKAVNNGICTIEEAREELGYAYKDGTDILLANGNLATLDVIKQGNNYNPYKNSHQAGGGE